MDALSTAVRTRQHPSRGVWTDQITGCFRKITVHQIAMAWWCHHAGHITRRQLRLYFAAHEMLERRRYTTDDGPQRPEFTIIEFSRLVGGQGTKSAESELSADLRRLGRLGLVRHSKHSIELAVSIDELTLDDIAGFWSMFNELPHPRRSVPVPRRMLRALAAGLSRGATAVVLATLIRSLFWHRNFDQYRIDGRTKREWIAEVFGLSLRSVTDGRARLIELGWLVPISSPQHMLNRYGSHDQINTDWYKADASTESGGGVRSASPADDFRGESASPDLNRSLPLTGNQKTRRPAPTRAGPAGVSRGSTLGSRKKSRRRPSGEPSIRDITNADLGDVGRLLELHHQATEIGFARPGEAGRLDFLSLAERARSRGQNPPALFFALLRDNRTKFITLADEDEARRRLKEHLYGKDERRQMGRGQWGGEDAEARPPREEFTDEDRFVVGCLRAGQNHRIDPVRIARDAKGWSREQWDEAREAFEERQLRRKMSLSGVQTELEA